jgi:NADH-quinone oxidoreductase subunit N
MMSLLGFPGTAGFIGKWYILLAAVTAGKAWLAAVLVLTSLISAGYYLPVVMAMYMRPAPFANAHAGLRFNRLGLTALAICVAAVLYFGIRPTGLLDLTRASGAAVRPAATVSAPRAGN